MCTPRSRLKTYFLVSRIAIILILFFLVNLFTMLILGELLQPLVFRKPILTSAISSVIEVAKPPILANLFSRH